jgi:hypothetical protein
MIASHTSSSPADRRAPMPISQPTEADIVREAARLLERAEHEGIVVRALGGTAVALRAGDAMHPAFRREIGDIDLATQARDARRLTAFLTAEGYTADRRFNAVHGARRLLFDDELRERRIDVLVDRFEMCHAISFADRLAVDTQTLPLVELVVMKLQIVQLNAKDRDDLYAMLLAHDVGSDDGPTINADRFAELCAGDWGLYRTMTGNLERLEADLSSVELSPAHADTIRTRVARLQDAAENRPKPLKWRARARIGDRVRWYEEPEEVTGADPGTEQDREETGDSA